MSRIDLRARLDQRLGLRLAGYGTLPTAAITTAPAPPGTLAVDLTDSPAQGALSVWWRASNCPPTGLASGEVPVGDGALEVGWWRSDRDGALEGLGPTAVIGAHEWSPAVTRRRIIRAAALALGAFLAGEATLVTSPVASFPLGPASLHRGRIGWRWLLRCGREGLDRVLRRARWQIALTVHPTEDPRLLPPVSSWTTARFDQLAADPMVEIGPSGPVLFFEVLIGRGRMRRGAIACAELDPRTASPGRARVVLQADSHISFPGLVREGDHTWLLPETLARREIRLYACDRWPDRWRPAQVLVADVAAVDPCLIRTEDGWILLAGICDVAGPEALALHAWHAPDLAGKFTPLQNAPLLLDARRVRAAGPLLPARPQGWYRPAQDGSARYGDAVHLLHTTQIARGILDETPVGRLETGSPAVPAHHLSHAGSLWASDTGWRESRLWALLDGTRRNRRGFGT